jgi:hypothetical protein
MPDALSFAAWLRHWPAWSLPPELPVAGMLVCAPLVVAVLAVLVALPILWLMDRAGLARFVWHPPLFTLAFYGLVYGILGLWLLPR